MGPVRHSNERWRNHIIMTGRNSILLANVMCNIRWDFFSNWSASSPLDKVTYWQSRGCGFGSWPLYYRHEPTPNKHCSLAVWVNKNICNFWPKFIVSLFFFLKRGFLFDSLMSNFFLHALLSGVVYYKILRKLHMGSLHISVDYMSANFVGFYDTMCSLFVCFSFFVLD